VAQTFLSACKNTDRNVCATFYVATASLPLVFSQRLEAVATKVATKDPHHSHKPKKG